MKKYLFIIAAILGLAAFSKSIKSNIMQTTTTKVNVWDTYVTKKDGKVMHFDILAPVAITETETIYASGKDYLKTKGQEGQPLTAKQCRLCHVETLRPSWEKSIEEKGYFIIEMEGCN